MANTFAPFGFRAFGAQEGASPTAGLTRRYLATSDTNLYFTGDVVTLSSGQGAGVGFLTLPTSGVAIGNTPILGVFAGCEYYNPSVGRVVWSSFFPGSQGSSAIVTAYVYEDPNQLFLVQCTTTAVVGTSAIGMNVGFTSSETLAPQKSGSQLSGISNIALNSSTVNTGSSGAASLLPFRIVDTTSNFAPPGTNGADGTTAGAILVVGFNNQARRSLTGVST
jgi:hypothetical protein